MEPATVLVGPFHVYISDTIVRSVFAVAQGKGMCRTGIEPHVQNIHNLIIFVGIDDTAKEAFLRAFLVPCVSAFGFERLDDTFIYLFVAQQEVGIGRQRTFQREAGQRHAPCPLA